MYTYDILVNGTFSEGLSMTNMERKKVAEKWKEVAEDNRYLYHFLKSLVIPIFSSPEHNVLKGSF